MQKYETANWTAVATWGLLVAALSFPQPVRAADGADRGGHAFLVTAPSSKLQMVETSSRIIQLRGKIASVDKFDTAVIQVDAVPNVANQIRVLANVAGVTDLLIVDEFNNHYDVEITVSGDVRQLEALIRNNFPDSAVKAVKIKDAVLLMGWVNQQDQLTPIIQMAEQFHPLVLNYIKVGGVQQVMLRVKIMEVQREHIRRLGFQFINQGQNGFATSTPGSLTPISQIQMPFGAPVTPPGVPGVSPLQTSLAATSATFGVFEGGNLFTGYLEALKTASLLKILAEPNLVTTNGRPANFIEGGSFPIPVSQGLGTVSIQWKDFGVELEFIPFILGAGRVRLEIAPSVSDQDFTKAVTLNGTTVPGISQRKVNTQVEMNFGQTMVIGGLLETHTIATRFSLPFLGELPWIGAAFRRVSHDQADTELLIMVTPELVAGMDASQVPPGGPGASTVAPTDKELFWYGMGEVPRTGDECEGCGAGGMGMEPIITPGSMAPYPGIVPPAARRKPSEPLPPPLNASGPNLNSGESEESPQQGASWIIESPGAPNVANRQNGRSAAGSPSYIRPASATSSANPSNPYKNGAANPNKNGRKRPGLITPGSSNSSPAAPANSATENRPGLINR